MSSRAIPRVPALRGKTVVSLFFEDSTRTRLSFETAARRLSADVMTFSVGSSSVNKGESLRDTVETIEAMGIDAVVVRHSGSGVPWQVARWVAGRVGDQRRRRVARAPDPGPARLLHHPPGAGVARRGPARSAAGRPSMDCTSPSSAIFATAGWPGPTCGPSRASGPR